MSATTTTITVRVLAYGGKFIGEPVGFAKVEIFQPGSSTPLASGLANQGLLPNTDGSGVTQLIMGQPYIWGTPIDSSQAVSFTADISLSEPTVLLFVATSLANPEIKEYSYRRVVPGVALTGDRAVVLVLYGLLTNLLSPSPNQSGISPGVPVTITAQVRMMCGCKIENHYWPVANFDVKALISLCGQTQTLTLNYTGTPSEFSAQYKFPSEGTYTISILATQTDGNVGITYPQVISVS
ncbi:MAG TPA: hypothetical protein VMD29_00125 [Terracidiphilus sp.]|nr:hypothetical protein [Terracidiphilus sp.]